MRPNQLLTEPTFLPQDFEEALKEVGPSVDPESSTIQVGGLGMGG